MSNWTWTALSDKERIAAVYLVTLVSAICSKRVKDKYPPGLRRCIALAPVIAWHICLPKAFYATDDLQIRFNVAINLTGLGLLKLLALLADRGPLAGTTSLSAFLLFYLLPLYPRRGGRKRHDCLSYPPWGLLDSIKMWVINSVFGFLLMYILGHVRLPKVAEHLAIICGFSAANINTQCMLNIIAIGLGLDVVPPMGPWWKATSIAEVWSRSWNLPMACLLREGVYEPLMEGSLVASSQGSPAADGSLQNQPEHNVDTLGTGRKNDPQQMKARPKVHRAQPPYLQRVLAHMATFLVSGLLHESIMAQIFKSYTFGWHFLFFALQTPICLMEGGLIAWARRTGLSQRVPNWLKTCLVFATMQPLISFLFFAPLDANPDVIPFKR